MKKDTTIRMSFVTQILNKSLLFFMKGVDKSSLFLPLINRTRVAGAVLSCVMCHMSPVTCLISFFFLHFVYNNKMKNKIKVSLKIGQSVGASQWAVCYQRGLPRLVIRYFRCFGPNADSV